MTPIARLHGILVQMPLPAHIDAATVLGSIDPTKESTAFIRAMSARRRVGAMTIAWLLANTFKDANQKK